MNKIIYDMPMDEYRDAEGFSKSSFKSILRSGLQYKHDLESPKKQSDFMVFGNLVDCLLLEPELFATNYSICPEVYPAKDIEKSWNWNANFCKEWRVSANDKGLTVITSEQYQNAVKIRDRILNHPTASKWLDGAKRQVSLFWEDPETGLQCKGRPDIINDGIMPDLKITNDPFPEPFSRTMNNFLYHSGASYYHDGYFLAQGLPIPEGGQSIATGFIVAEDKEPFDVICYTLDEESFEIGREIYRSALQKRLEIEETNEFYGYSNISEDIGIPQYVKNKYFFEGVL